MSLLSNQVKLYIAVLLHLITSVAASGQIVKEKNYSTEQFYVWTIDSTEQAYCSYDIDKSTVSIYDLQHKLISQTTLKIPSGYSYSGSSFFYRRVFDRDNGIEHRAILSETNSSNRIIIIYDDDGSPLMRFDSAINAQPIYSVQGAKMIVSKWYNQKRFGYDVYALPGKIPTQKPAPFEESALEIYPNPAVNSVELAYQLPENQTIGKIHVYDVKGNLMETVLVGPAFREVEIDVSFYPSGLYIAKLDEREVKKFVVEK